MLLTKQRSHVLGRPLLQVKSLHELVLRQGLGLEACLLPVKIRAACTAGDDKRRWITHTWGGHKCAN